MGKQLSPWYEEAAEYGDPRAQYNLGRLLVHGLGSHETDEAAGKMWYRKAAQQGHVMAMYNLAVRLHRRGTGSPEEEEEAGRWYASAANLGHPQAMTNYGSLWNFGHCGLRVNKTAAVEW